MSIFRTRRSVKPMDMDSAREVPGETVEALLEDAIWAPTHRLTQPWRFHVFAPSEARERLAAGLGAIYDETTPADDQDDDRRAKLTEFVRRAPVVVAVVMRHVPEERVPEWEEVAATACAVENFMLSAHGRGLVTSWRSPAAACAPEFVRWLGLDDHHRALGLVYLGWPRAGLPERRPARLPLAERVVWHTE